MSFKRILALTLSGIMLFSMSNTAFAENADASEAESGIKEEFAQNTEKSESGYLKYLEKYEKYSRNPEKTVILAGDDNISGENITLEENYLGSNSSAVIIKEGTSADFTVDVKEDSLYQIELKYWSASKNTGNLEQTLKIDGKIPFKECNYIILSKTWIDKGDKKQDIVGNDLKRPSEEKKTLSTVKISDPAGFISEPFAFGFEKGEHKITIESTLGGLAVRSLTLEPVEKLKNYAEIKKNYKNNNYTQVDNFRHITLEGEDYFAKSDVTVYPVNDRTSYQTYPQSPYVIKLNTVGGAKWKNCGQWISWKFKVEKPGLYKIGIRFRQALVDGSTVSRRLYIDGKVPFLEADDLKFVYSSKFITDSLGEKDGYEFYLDKGEHEIKLEVSLGNLGESLGNINKSLLRLNEIYRNILMITGSVPDADRDYGFERLIPEQIEQLDKEYRTLTEAVNQIKKGTGDSSYVSVINKITHQLKKMHSNPRSIAKNLQQFKANLGALSTWLITAREQPLEIDRIYLYSGENLDFAENYNFFKSLWFGAKCFFASFINDYNNIGQSVDFDSDRSVVVWVQTGRDQAQILRQLTDNYFSVPEKIKVNIKLVAPGSLLPSTLANTGPDVALDNAKSDPINYAIRNANLDLKQFKDFDEVAERFNKSSLEPYSIDGKVFALPQTLTFPMFFYRTDIFEQLGIEVPKSWDDIVSMIPVLQRNNMTMGFPANINGYAMMMYKIGGEFYKNGGETTNLNSDKALEAFEEFTELYTLWGLPTEYDFPNRFRTGEMPCGIQDYTMYNNLSVFATEIKGLWEFIPVPMTIDENGNTESLSIGDGTNVMIMKNARDAVASWKFVKWWLSEEAQSMYGVEMESVLGPAGKHPTANINALFKMSWTGKESHNISEQLKTVKTVPEVPGGYYTTRVVDFAFSRVYNTNENPSEIIVNYIDELNDELRRKRREFGY